MRSLSFIIILFVISFSVTKAQSPHGKDLKYDCSDCHQSNNWNVLQKNMNFDHSKTEFNLSNQHTVVNCTACHQSLVFSKAKEKQNCFSCHKDIHQNTVGLNCESCHTSKSWLLTDIDEIHQENRFPLTGIHQVADCIQCHKKFDNFNFEPIGSNCYDCHSSDFTATTQPNHVALGYSTNCESCHSVSTVIWSVDNINHDFFPLSGGHSISNCFSCHEQNKVFSTISSDCYSCHKKDFDAALNPNHKLEGFSTNCQECHNINSFVPSTFQHDNSSFPLTGKHNVINCSDCHTNGYTVKLSVDCYSCHQTQFENTTDPNHVVNAFPTDCSECHSTNDWQSATFNHQSTSFPLQGAHVSLDCSTCHTNGYKGTPTDCYSCHKDQFDATTDPNHITSGFPTDCVQCHTQNAWKPATFDHNNTAFPLEGAHITLDCNSCHSTGFKGTPTDCFLCHKEQYNSTTTPNHITSGISTDCLQCHSQNTWTQPSIDHGFYPLSSPHLPASITCQSCHSKPNFQPDCWSCHSNDFFKEHKTGDPTDCWRCHKTNNWDSNEGD